MSRSGLAGAADTASPASVSQAPAASPGPSPGPSPATSPEAVMAAACLPDAPLAMPEQRLDPVGPVRFLGALLAAPGRRAAP